MQKSLEKLDKVKQFYLNYLKTKKRGILAAVTYRLKDPEIKTTLDLLVPLPYNLSLKFHMWCIRNYELPKCLYCTKDLLFNLKKGFYTSTKHRCCFKPPYNNIYSNYEQFFNMPSLMKVDYKTFIQRPNIKKIITEFLEKFPYFSDYKTHIFSLFSYVKNYDDLSSIPYCRICGKNKVSINLTLLSKNKIYFNDYCFSCVQKSTMEKSISSIKQKYNVTNVSQLDFVKKKKEQTSLKNYHVKNPMQSEIVRSSHKQTCIDRYGVENVSQSDQIKVQKKETILKNFGNWETFIQHTLGAFCKSKGVENVSQLKEVKDKKILTFLNHYGVENCFQSEEIKSQSKLTCLNRYGYEYYSQSIEARRNTRERLLNQIEIQFLNGEPLVPTIGIFERECFNYLERECNIQILRNSRCIGYFVDGFIPYINLCIEFDEEFHFDKYGNLLDVDLRRQKEIQDYLSCEFFRISKKNWNVNRERVVTNFKEIMEKCSNKISDNNIKVIFENRQYRIIRSNYEDKENK